MRRCQACGQTDGIQVHHIIFRSQFGSNREEEQEAQDNKIDLCFGCHFKVHARVLLVFKTKQQILFVHHTLANKITDNDSIRGNLIELE